jgi:hypothetical protein
VAQPSTPSECMPLNCRVPHPSVFEGRRFGSSVATGGWSTNVSRFIAFPVTDGYVRRTATSDFINYKRSKKMLVGAVGIEKTTLFWNRLVLQ